MGTATDSDDDFLADVDDKDLDEWADEDFDDLDDVDLDAGDASATAPAAAQPSPPSAKVTQDAIKVVEAQEEEEEEEQEEEEEEQVNPFLGFGGWGAKTAKPQSSGWGWSKTFSKMSSVVSSVADAVDGQLAELQSKVADMVVPEPEQEEAEEQGETSGAAIDDHRKREALMAKFGEAADDDEIDDNLKALDDQMEDLAMNAIGLLGQAWKGANKLAASAAEEFKEGLKDVKELHLVQVVQSGAQRVASKGVGALERLGDTALDLLARPSGWDRDRSALDDLAPQEVSFEKCFYIHGGPDYLEELELVGGDAAVRCTRHRRKLTEGSPEQADFASTEERLRVMLNLDEPLPGDGDDDNDTDEAAALAAEQAAKGPTVASLNSLLSESMRRAEGLTLATVSAIKSEAMAAADGDVDGAEALELSRSALETVRAEGVRQLSEQCTLCVAHLLQLTVGLVEVMNGDQPAPEAPAWPEAASGKALLLRHFARHMVSTLDNVVEVYMTALSTSAAACDGSEVDELSELRGECDEMRSDLRIECGSASSRVQDALNHLVALLLVTTLPEEEKEEMEEEEEEEEQKGAAGEEAQEQETTADEEGEEAAAVKEVVAEEGQEAAAEQEAASAQPVSVEAVPEEPVSDEAVPEEELVEDKEPAAQAGVKGKGKGKNKKKNKR